MGKKLKILIVEDEFISRTLLKAMLSPLGDCDLAANGLEAVEALEKAYGGAGERYDLVCLDIMMPKLNGHEVLREMRSIEKEHGITQAEAAKVMMITALDDAKNIMKALVDGRCEAYLTKPVDKSRLEEQLRHLQLLESPT